MPYFELLAEGRRGVAAMPEGAEVVLEVAPPVASLVTLLVLAKMPCMGRQSKYLGEERVRI